MTLEFVFENILTLAIFLGLYLTFFRWQRYFIVNRLYLLTSIVLSIVIPLLSFDVWPEVILIEPYQPADTHIAINKQIPSSSINWILIYLGISGVLVSYFTFKIISQYYRIIRFPIFKKINNTQIRINDLSNDSYSFFNQVVLSNIEDKTILEHELTHVRHLHSIDRLLILFIQSLLWFNPLYFLVSKLIIENHEFVADQSTINKNKLKKSEFGVKLISFDSFGKNTQILTNNFSSLIKNRLTMISKQNQSNKLRYLLILPVLLITLSTFCFQTYPVYVENDKPYSDIVEMLNDFTGVDSLPLNTDTIIIFDPETKKEEVRIVESHASPPEIFNTTDTIVIFDTESHEETTRIVRSFDFDKFAKSLGGEKHMFIDTVITFDPNTLKEDIKVVRTELPKEIFLILQKYPYLESSVPSQYIKKSVLDISTDDSYLSIPVKQMPEELIVSHQDGTFVKMLKVNDPSGKVHVSSLNLKKGTYLITQKSTGIVTEITIK